MAKPILTNEEKAGKKIEDILSDSRLDVEQMGIYFGRFAWYENIEKLKTMSDASIESRKQFLKNIKQDVQPRTAVKLSGQETLPAETTSFNTKARILSDIWLNERDEEAVQEVIEYSDLGMPLAYAHCEGYVVLDDRAKAFIEEVYNMLLKALEIPEDTYFEDEGDYQDYMENR